ncbi:MAG TPA: PAS domain-containing protein [Jatrophihabitans sp.]|uniref:PAS domain-containing sensor histidine kinase n=1 Tax=Jatrophihabitans sp. TaxID=1932789 RepID=UPI002DF943F6|nr:PAS domain-containing protein [Jatrophihabitans sp.]
MNGPTTYGSPDLAAALRRVTDGIASVNADWRCSYINDVGAAMIGRTPSEVIGRDIWTIFPEALGTAFETAFTDALRHQQAVEFEEYLEPVGRWFSLRVFPSHDAITLYFRDVTEVRAAEAAQQQAARELAEAYAQRARFRALLDASEDYIGIADLEGRALYLNPGGRALVGLSPESDIRTLTIRDLLPPQWVEQAMTVEVPAIRRDGSWSGEHELLDHRGGPPIPVRVSSFLLRDPDTGRPVALATVQRDIRDERAANERLRRVAEQRRLLAARLVAEHDDERARIAAEVQADAVERMTDLSSEFEQLQQQLQGAVPELEETMGQLGDALAGTIERLRDLLFDLEPDDVERSLADGLRTVIAHVFEHAPVHCELTPAAAADLAPQQRSHALRIAREALNNARAHARASRLEVSAVARDGGVEVSVVDDGVGFDPARESRPGHRGLVAMRDRAEIAGGRFEVRPAPPHGTAVVFWLPAEPPDPR